MLWGWMRVRQKVETMSGATVATTETLKLHCGSCKQSESQTMWLQKANISCLNIYLH